MTLTPWAVPPGVSSGPLRADLARRALDVRDLADLVREICCRHHVLESELLGRCRRREVSEARAHLCHELYERLGSYPSVGRVLGLDHTSVMYSRRKWARIVGEAWAA